MVGERERGLTPSAHINSRRASIRVSARQGGACPRTWFRQSRRIQGKPTCDPTSPTSKPPDAAPTPCAATTNCGADGSAPTSDPSTQPPRPNLSNEMTNEQLTAIRARLDEPPPIIALAGRNHGVTPIVEYLALLREDRIALVEEIDRLRAEL